MTPSQKKLTFADFNKQADWLGQQLVVAQWSERLTWSGLEIIDDEFMTRTRSDSPHHEFHNVLATRIQQSRIGRDLDRCLAILAAETQPSRWFLNAHNQELEITQQLISRGFDDFTSFSVMAADIESIEDSAFSQRLWPKVLDISELTEDYQLKSWVEALARIYELPDDLANTCLDMVLGCGFGANQPWRYYVCRINGVPAGILSVLWTDQLVTIEVLGVLPDFRHQGVGKALLQHAVSDAHKAGYKVVVSWPMSDARGIYEHYGFKLVGVINCVTIKNEQVEKYRDDPPAELIDKPPAGPKIGELWLQN